MNESKRNEIITNNEDEKLNKFLDKGRTFPEREVLLAELLEYWDVVLFEMSDEELKDMYLDKIGGELL